MKKYLQIFSISWSNGFVYRLNFIMWRVRMVIQLLSIYFLWAAILSKNHSVFGYTGHTLLTYILGSSIIRAVVMSAQSSGLQSDISSGDLNNYLIKPITVSGYWFSRDMADKGLNLLFSLGEIICLYLLLRPPLEAPASLLHGLLALGLTLGAVLLYFYFSYLISCTVFWLPEGNGWPQRFFIFTLIEFFSGSLFPLDILPAPVYAVLSRLPTAYMLNIPMQMYLGRIPLPQLSATVGIFFFWLTTFWLTARLMFNRGVKVYGAYGR